MRRELTFKAAIMQNRLNLESKTSATKEERNLKDFLDVSFEEAMSKTEVTVRKYLA